MVLISKLRRSCNLSYCNIIDPFFLTRSKPDQVKPRVAFKREVFKQPRKGTKEYKDVLVQQKELKKEMRQKSLYEQLTPKFVSALIFGAAMPHSFLLYPMIWNDALSDEFFQAIQYSIYWVASLNALEGAAATGLGYIDYKTKAGNDPSLVYAMRKKRLAFSKFSFFMATLTLLLLDVPTANCVFPLIISSLWNALKLGTQIGYNLTPERFFYSRTFLSIYNLIFLLLIWYKLRQSRKEKLDLEFTFYQRVEGLMLRMSNIFQDQTFGESKLDAQM